MSNFKYHIYAQDSRMVVFAAAGDTGLVEIALYQLNPIGFSSISRQ